MKVLLDTHILEWMTRDPAALTNREKAVIGDAAHTLLVSPVSIWELRLKWNKRDRAGLRKGLLDPAAALSYVQDTAIELAVLTVFDCAASLSIPTPHKDPFDQLLLIHAQRLGAKLLTRDGALLGHPLVVQL